MKKNASLFFSALTISLLFLTVNTILALNNYEVYVLLHERTTRENTTYMLNDLHGVDGVDVMLNLYDNTTIAMDEAIDRLESYLQTLTEYNIIIQAIYSFKNRYIPEDGAHWQF